MESLGSLKDEPAHLSEQYAKISNSAEAAAAAAAAAAAEAEDEALWLMNFRPSNHNLDRIASSARAASPTSVIKSIMRKASAALQREGKSSTPSTSFSIWEGLTGSVMQGKRETKKVKFCTTAQCVLIPSRSDLQTQGIDELLWFSDSVSGMLMDGQTLRQRRGEERRGEERRGEK